MKLPEHIALSFLLAQFGVQEQYGPLGTSLVIAAGCLPDLDGLGIVFGWRLYRRYHRILGHGLPLTCCGPLLLALFGAHFLGTEALAPLWLWLQVSLFLHLFTDVAFYNWPVQLLWPLSRRGAAFDLIGWNDLMPTLVLYAGCLGTLAWPVVSAVLGICGFFLYLGWRALCRAPATGWAGWLAGGWAVGVHPVWRWLTGDFIS